MFIEHSKLTEEVKFQVTHDKLDTHVFTIKAKLGDWTQAMLSLTPKEAESLFEQLGFAIQDYNVTKDEGKDG